VSKNREHMAQIGRKGGEASRRSKAAHSAGPGDQPSATAMGPAGAKPGLTTQPKPEKPSGEGSTGT
jgi:general stress protein YciG